MVIRSAEFLASAAKPGEYPPCAVPEVAFAGRSNVGKSSLINTLADRKKLVRTSQSPGRTRRLNFFEVNKAVRFVDLPGYGYARVSKKERDSWGPMVEAYLGGRECLAGVVVICDLRRKPGQEEKDLLHWLSVHGVRAFVVATKADKLGRSKRAAAKKDVASALGRDPKEVVLFSSTTRLGREELWKQIAEAAGIPYEPCRKKTAP
ncbi:MAG: YihA family ribosome biogenesis GTP-binding protein [Deltaproteobacteria bacterium]|nr:YihA family ribosome biogenesis GTP-binding protein [Deltaproteobacteria bacterium]